MRPKRSELPILYGQQAGCIWPDEPRHMLKVEVPTLLRVQIGHERIYCNKDMAVPLRQALDNVVDRGLAAELKSFDGCFCIRPSRTDSKPSVHSWGLAVDINAATNQLGSAGDLSPELVACFEDEGFVWGGRWKHLDPMHFQFVTEA